MKHSIRPHALRRDCLPLMAHNVAVPIRPYIQQQHKGAVSSREGRQGVSFPLYVRLYKSSPAARGAEEASITVIFYAAGNPHFKDAADYLARQTEPLPVVPVGEEAGPAVPAKLGALPGKTLWRTRPVGRPPEAVKRGAKLRAELTVAQGEGGFWVFTCAAPSERFKRLRGAFDAARRSFAATRPKGP